MKRGIFQIFLMIATVATARAHFVFVVPEPGMREAKVFISEELKPTGEVDLGIIKGARLSLLDSSGHDITLTMSKGDNAFLVSLPGSGNRVIHGSVDLGFAENRGPKPYLLMYYPKTILGDAFDSKATLLSQTPVQIVPAGKPGALTLRLLAYGKPQPNAEIAVILPDATQKKVKTNSAGETEAMSQTGRYGAWARFWEPSSGERDGKKFEEIRHYATLVFDAPSRNEITQAGGGAKLVATLPQAASSFGSVVDDGWLYVYGGHISPTHSYSTAAVSGQFNRLRLSGEPKWEKLPDGPGMQGMNLAALDGKIYRVGGMEPRNAPGAPADNYSLADCARFDPTSDKWETLPSLPGPRSSHDVVVIGRKLFVVGGWAIHGEKNTWAETMAVLNLAEPNPEWKSIPQPFKRRALMAAAYEGKVYVIGGFDEKNRIVRDVSVFDPATGVWGEGPKIPSGPGLSFAPAACTHNGKLYVSVSDGTLYSLNPTSQQWEKVGQSTPRLAHRIASAGNNVLVIGGADEGKNSDLVEAILIK